MKDQYALCRSMLDSAVSAYNVEKETQGIYESEHRVLRRAEEA